MSFQPFDSRQSAFRGILSYLFPWISNPNLSQLMSSVDAETAIPLYVTATSTPSLTVNVAGTTISNPTSSRQKSAFFVNGIVPSLSSGTFTFPSTSGGNITSSTGFSVALTLTSGNYCKVLLYIDSSNNLKALAGTSASTSTAALVPGPVANAHSFAYVILQNVGGTIQNVTQTNIVQFASESGMSNPMTTTGDLIYGSTTGSPSVPARLGIGSNGQVLTVSSGALTWAAASSGYVPTAHVFTSSGTFTVPAGITNIMVEVVGGGGSGANSIGGNNYGGGGGGAGGYAKKTISVTSGTTYSYVVGSGGSGSGSAGSISWFNTSSYLYANGGSGGNTVAIGGNGGSAGGGNFNLNGGPGGTGGGSGGIIGTGGSGGNNPYGFGGGGTNGSGGGTGASAAGYGAGGGGNDGGNYYSYGNGTNGVVIITY